MTRSNPYTQRQIQRAIKAARAEGLRVTGVKPDGTVLTEENSGAAPVPALTAAGKARDAREKLGVH
jgi:hypothetical protein